MARPIEFHFDFMSPYSYLATTQFGALRADTGTEIVYRPIRILELMKLVSNQPTPECKNKLNTPAPISAGGRRAPGAVPAQSQHARLRLRRLRRAALVAIELGRGDACVSALYRAVWAGDANLGERPMLAALLDKAGLDGQGLLEKSDAPHYTKQLDEATAAAAERGVFGSPTFFVGEQMFFGNDRLDFVAAAAKAA
jgi:2-hydroxychromene-2-carboxylate isomerase